MTAARSSHRVASGGLTVPEGPRWHDRALWFSDFFSRRVLRWEPDTARLSTVFTVSGRPSGLGFLPDGRLRVVSMDDLLLLEWDGTHVRTVADLAGYVTGPANDMVMTADGTAFIGNFGLDPRDVATARPTRLLSVDLRGTVSIAADDVLFPNGMAIDPDGPTLLVAETYRCRITAFDLSTDSRLGHRRTWAEFAPDPGAYHIPTVTKVLPIIPDGIARDAEGMLWVADAKGHGATRVSPGGAVVDFVDSGENSVYAVALGGHDGRDLYLCCAPPVETVDPAQAMAGELRLARVEIPAS